MFVGKTLLTCVILDSSTTLPVNPVTDTQNKSSSDNTNESDSIDDNLPAEDDQTTSTQPADEVEEPSTNSDSLDNKSSGNTTSASITEGIDSFIEEIEAETGNKNGLGLSMKERFLSF